MMRPQIAVFAILVVSLFVCLMLLLPKRLHEPPTKQKRKERQCPTHLEEQPEEKPPLKDKREGAEQKRAENNEQKTERPWWDLRDEEQRSFSHPDLQVDAAQARKIAQDFLLNFRDYLGLPKEVAEKEAQNLKLVYFYGSKRIYAAFDFLYHFKGEHCRVEVSGLDGRIAGYRCWKWFKEYPDDESCISMEDAEKLAIEFASKLYPYFAPEGYSEMIEAQERPRGRGIYRFEFESKLPKGYYKQRIAVVWVEISRKRGVVREYGASPRLPPIKEPPRITEEQAWQIAASIYTVYKKEEAALRVVPSPKSRKESILVWQLCFYRMSREEAEERASRGEGWFADLAKPVLMWIDAHTGEIVCRSIPLRAPAPKGKK